MSPAHTYIEQSRNTLLFATCAKEIITNAHVNVVMSDKALVKHLQRELARLENELKFPGSASCTTHTEALREKDAQIKKVHFSLIKFVVLGTLLVALFSLLCTVRSSLFLFPA